MAVVDNNVLSSLAKVERLDLLPSILGEVATTPEVEHEFRDERIAGFDVVGRIHAVTSYGSPAKEAWLEVVSPTGAEREGAERLLDAGLAPADAECLSVARSRGALLVTDDRQLARVASHHGVEVVDLETVLLAAAMRGELGGRSEARELLGMISERDFYTFSAGFEEQLLGAISNGG